MVCNAGKINVFNLQMQTLEQKLKWSATDDLDSQSQLCPHLYFIFKLTKSNSQKVENNRNKLSCSSTHKFRLSKTTQLVNANHRRISTD